MQVRKHLIPRYYSGPPIGLGEGMFMGPPEFEIGIKLIQKLLIL